MKSNTSSKNGITESGKIVQHISWDFFITIQYGLGCSERKNRYMLTNLVKQIPSIKTLFFVSERNKDYFNVHTHFLIQSSNLTETKTQLNTFLKKQKMVDVDIKDITSNTDDENIGLYNYITKYLDKGIDFDFLPY